MFTVYLKRDLQFYTFCFCSLNLQYFDIKFVMSRHLSPHARTRTRTYVHTLLPYLTCQTYYVCLKDNHVNVLQFV